MSHTSEIKLHVTLDENKVPKNIEWTATDNNVVNSPVRAMMLSLWDPAENNTLRIDLWTQEMMVEEMKHFVHQQLMLMAETFERSTGETQMATAMREFGKFFGEKMNVIEPINPTQQ
jgi:gliding motility-associated protein GldC